jgi:hypothetical protein
VIHDVDESLRKLVVRDAINGSGVEVSFEAPNKDWSSRRNAPTVNIYLYDVREDLDRRELAFEEIRAEGRVVERRPPPRRFKLSYLVTVWTQRPEDEHRLLSTLLACFLAHETLPVDVMPPSLAAVPYVTLLTVGMPPPKDRALADVWSALGGELKPSLDLVLTAPFETGRVLAAGPPVVEEPRFEIVRPADGASAPEPERIGRPRVRRPDPARSEPEQDESISAGKDAGRVVRVRDVPRR